jgi:hypothetical protein
MTIARNRAGGAVAPKTGTINKIRLIACAPGSFVLQIARTSGNQARAIRTGPLINYQGDQQRCQGDDQTTFRIESFTVNVPVTQGDRLSVVGNKVGFVYCAGDNGSLLFRPPLADSRPLRTATDRGDCIMLLEAHYND